MDDTRALRFPCFPMHLPAAKTPELIDVTGMPLSTIGIISHPAAGKGTLVEGMAAQLAQRGARLAKFGSGEMVDQEIEQGTEWGRQVERIRNEGGLVPNEMIERKIEDRIIQLHLDNEDAALKAIDGAPRMEEQMRWFEGLMEKLRTRYAIVFLNVTRREAEHRMILRGRRAEAAKKKVRKEDVNPEARKNRLDISETQLGIMLEYFGAQGKIIEIDGMDTIEGVQQQAREKILACVSGFETRHHPSDQRIPAAQS